MTFNHFPIESAGEDPVIVPLGNGRLSVQLAGVTFILRELTREISRTATSHQCVVEELRVSTWQYQLLSEHVRIELADIITIVER